MNPSVVYGSLNLEQPVSWPKIVQVQYTISVLHRVFSIICLKVLWDRNVAFASE